MPVFRFKSWLPRCVTLNFFLFMKLGFPLFSNSRSPYTIKIKLHIFKVIFYFSYLSIFSFVSQAFVACIPNFFLPSLMRRFKVKIFLSSYYSYSYSLECCPFCMWCLLRFVLFFFWKSNLPIYIILHAVVLFICVHLFRLISLFFFDPLFQLTLVYLTIKWLVLWIVEWLCDYKVLDPNSLTEPPLWSWKMHIDELF